MLARVRKALAPTVLVVSLLIPDVALVSGRVEEVSLAGVVEGAPIIVVATGAKPIEAKAEAKYRLRNYKGEEVEEAFSGAVLRFEITEILKNDLGTWMTTAQGRKSLSPAPGAELPRTVSVVDADLGLRFYLSLRSLRDGVNKIPIYQRYESTLVLPALQALEGRSVILFLQPPPRGEPQEKAPEREFQRAFGAHYRFSISGGIEDVKQRKQIEKLIAAGYEGDEKPPPKKL
jgi:hypothetical protein